MSGAEPRKPTPTSLGAFTISHWELLALLRILRVASIPGQDDDGVVQREGRPSQAEIEARVRVAADDLAARGFANVVSGPEAKPGDAPTIAIATPVLAMLAACASSRYSIRINTIVKGAQAESYLHEWEQLGVVHGIQHDSASHLFIPVARRAGILNAVSQLTDGESRSAHATPGAQLAVIPAQTLKQALADAPRGGENQVERILSASTTSAWSGEQRRDFAYTLAHAARFDEIGIGIKADGVAYQANALRIVRGGQEYLCCVSDYAEQDGADYHVLVGGPGLVARWIEPLIP